jgi:hypothetical protein
MILKRRRRRKTLKRI